MLFHYAVEATEDNWLHDTIVEMLSAGMDELDAGEPLSPWPDCIPAVRLDILSARTGLRDRRAKFFCKYSALTQQARMDVRGALTTQNAIPAIYDGQSPWVRLEDLPPTIREPAKELFRFAFGLLTPLELRDRHYNIIWQQLPAKTCPFCGLERLSHPEEPRPDLDHYLSISSYPFAGANLRNLAPMGDRCNKAFKGTTDVVFDNVANNRRKCCDPYLGPHFSISLNASELLSGDGAIRPLPRWVLEFIGTETHCASTWNSVFHIERRYYHVLNDEYRGWVAHFGKWCADPRSGVEITDIASVIAALDQHLGIILQEEKFVDVNFLKHATFQMLRTKCAVGPDAQRVADWLQEVVSSYASEIVV